MSEHPASWLALLVLLLALLIPAPVVFAIQASPAMDLPTYITELEHWSDAFAALEENPQQWEELRSSLTPAWFVTVDGETFGYSTDWLDDALQTFGSSPDLRSAVLTSVQGRLAALHDDAVALTLQSPGVPTATATARLEEILGQREFRAAREVSLWGQIEELVGSWLTRLLNLIFGPLAGRPWVGRALIWLAIFGAFVLAVVMVWRVWMREPAPQVFDPGGSPAAVEGWLTWRARAMTAASRGEYAEAVRCAYWVAVLWLAETGVWRTDLARTPREYLRMLPAGHTGGAPLDALTRRFEEVWYRRQTGTPDDFRDAMKKLEALGCPLSKTVPTENS